jgi:hypothetical protein
MPLTTFKTKKRRRLPKLRQQKRKCVSHDLDSERITSPSSPPDSTHSSSSSSSSYTPSSPESPSNVSSGQRIPAVDDRDNLCRAQMPALVDLLSSMGFVDYFTSDAGGKLSMTSVKLYISRLQHFMVFCRSSTRSANSNELAVIDVNSFLDLWELILRRLNVLLPSYTQELTLREELAPDTVRNIVNQFKAIIKWYLLYASDWRESRLDIHTTNMLFIQSMDLCGQLTRQFNKAATKRRTASGKDLIEFRVSIDYANCYILFLFYCVVSI